MRPALLFPGQAQVQSSDAECRCGAVGSGHRSHFVSGQPELNRS